jgi:hypothetical protein
MTLENSFSPFPLLIIITPSTFYNSKNRDANNYTLASHFIFQMESFAVHPSSPTTPNPIIMI